MARDKVRKLRDEASKAMDRGRYKKALQCYLELEALEPREGNWSRRAADCYRRLDSDDDMVISLMRAADRYSEAGFLVKGIAMCKMILAHDPTHTETLQRLAGLHSERGMPPSGAVSGRQSLVSAPPVDAATDTPIVPVPEVPKRARTLPPGAAVEEVALNQVISNSCMVGGSEDDPSGVYEIPIDEVEILMDDELGDAPAVTATPMEVVGNEFHHDPPSVPPPVPPARPRRRRARETAEQLFPRTPLFSDLSVASLRLLIGKVGLRQLASGDALFEQGDNSESLYVVADGAVVVVSEGPPRVQLNRLEEGEFFGEIGLLSNQPRVATVRAAEGGAVLLEIGRDAIGDLVDDEPQVLKVLLRFMRDRLLRTLVQTSPLFEPFGGSEREALAGRFRFLEAEQGSEFVVQGSLADGLFILLTGKAEVVRDTAGLAKRLATLGPGDLFGEMSLLTREPAVASVRAITKIFALELPAQAFREVIMTHPQVLMFVGELADQRRLQNTAIAGGEADYTEGHLDLL